MESSEVPAVAGLLRDALARRYLLEREVGRGGMATVYVGRDVKHGRAVAVKVLHAELAAAVGPERFLREIELTASLQHPHILPLFDSGATNGLLWYVMPFVDGETLRARLERERQLPVPVAERIAREVADALAYAHARGVVHRDVKPENILLQDGHALVADFGIALAAQRADGSRLTGTGLMLGTAQYMAPEQGSGDGVVDARADVYALGAVLYEMLVGEPPYTGPTPQVVIARALTEQPRAIAATRPSVPARLAAIVDTALAKLPADRFESAAAMRDALARGDRPSVTRVLALGAAHGGWRSRAALVGGAALLAGAALGVAGALAVRDDAPPRATRRPVQFVLEPDSGLLSRTAPALSPDGRTIVYGMEGPDGMLRLYARPLDSLEARAIPESEDAEVPFFSPDGQWVGFVRANDIHLVSVDGQQARHVARVPAEYTVTQVSWMRGDTLAIATASPVVLAAPATGGDTKALWRTSAFVPIVAASPLPDGRMLLTMAANSTAVPGGWLLGILDRSTQRVTPLGEGIGGRWADGEVVYGDREGTLYARALDLAKGQWSGPPRRIGSDVQFARNLPAFAVSHGGTVAWRVGFSTTPSNGRMRLLDSTGRELRAFTARAPWAPRLSPDGRRLAYGAAGPSRTTSDLWVTDLADGSTQRITNDSSDSNDPVWSPDGRELAMSAASPDTGWKSVELRRLDGGGPRRFATATLFAIPSDWSRDGSTLLITTVDLRDVSSAHAKPLAGGASRKLFDGDGRGGARFSPDGRWIAYTSDETGRRQVYVQSWPALDGKTLVSTHGGVHPVWAREGLALFYWQDDELVSVRLAPRAGGGLAVASRTPLFRAPYLESLQPNYDVLPGGKQFVVVTWRARANRIAVALDALGAAK